MELKYHTGFGNGFGKGNLKALFVSIVEEQRRRGNL